MEALGLGDVPTESSVDAKAYSGGQIKYLPPLDAKSADYKDANLQYDATSSDWSFKGLDLTDDNLPLLFPDSTITDAEIQTLMNRPV